MPTVRVTFAESPNVSPIIIDNILYLPQQLPLSFDWTQGSYHSVEITDAKVSNAQGNVSTFWEWNDLDNSRNRVIQALSDFNYIAVFNTQVTGVGNTADTSTLTFDTYPRQAGLIVDGKLYLPTQLPRSFVWPIGSSHSLSVEKAVMPIAEQSRLIFTGWDDLDSHAVRSIIVNESTSLTALFDTQYFLRIDSQYGGNPKGQGWYAGFETAHISIDPQVAIIAGKERAVFSSWSEGDTKYSPNNELIMSGPKTLSPSWTLQHYVEIFNPISAQSGANITGLTTSGAGWYNDNSNAVVSAVPVYEPNKNHHEYRFHQWTNDGNGEIQTDELQLARSIVKVTGPVAIQPVYDEFWYLQLSSTYGNPSGEGYYRAGDTAKVNVTSPANEIREQSRWAIDYWSVGNQSLGQDGSQIQVIMDNYKEAIAHWKQQYFLKVLSAYGGVSGAGWYDKGSIAELTTQNPQNTWSGDLMGKSTQGSLLMDGPHIVRATADSPEYLSSYYLAVAAGVAGLGSIIIYRYSSARLKRIKGSSSARINRD